MLDITLCGKGEEAASAQGGGEVAPAGADVAVDSEK